MKTRLPARAYPRTGLSCTVERECLGWVRLLDEAKDKYREKLHQNSGHRHLLEDLQPRTAFREGIGKVKVKQRCSRESKEAWFVCCEIFVLGDISSGCKCHDTNPIDPGEYNEEVRPDEH